MTTPFRIAAATGLAALLVLAGSCSNLPTDTAAPGKAGGDVRLALVDNARWSMSAHNMQSWDSLSTRLIPWPSLSPSPMEGFCLRRTPTRGSSSCPLAAFSR